jgi:hypothetical protein
MAPLRWCHKPGFSGVILRRTYPELLELIDRTKSIYPRVIPGLTLDGWNESKKRWTFPSGATLQMAAADLPDDILKLKSFEFQYVAFDELTSFLESQYSFMLSRNRTTDVELPLHVRSGTNPGGVGHAWVAKRFVKDVEPYKQTAETLILPDGQRALMTREFIPATVYDNPYLANRNEYVAGLLTMGTDLALAMLHGRWDVFEGQFFNQMPEEIEPVLADPGNYYVIRCMDFGSFHDSTAVYWLVVYPRLLKADIIAELYVNELTIPDVAGMLKRRENRLIDEDGVKKRPVLLPADPSIFSREATSQQAVSDIFLRHGVSWSRANNDRVAGWAMLRYLINDGKLRCWKGRAPMLYETLPGLKYDPNNKDDVYKRGKVDDHCGDALRYGVLTWYETPVPLDSPPLVDPAVQDTLFPKLIARIKKLQEQGFQGKHWMDDAWQ